MDTTLFYTSAQVAERTGLPEDTVRRIVRREVASFTPDDQRFIPGGRVDGKVLRIYATIFEAVVSGWAVTRSAPVSRIDPIKRRKVSMTTDPTPITYDPAQQPTTNPEPMTLEEAYALFAIFCAALREVGQDLKAQQAAGSEGDTPVRL